MKPTWFAVAGLALLLGLSIPALAARSTGDLPTSEQATKTGDTQIAGFLLSEKTFLQRFALGIKALITDLT